MLISIDGRLIGGIVIGRLRLLMKLFRLVNNVFISLVRLVCNSSIVLSMSGMGLRLDGIEIDGRFGVDGNFNAVSNVLMVLLIGGVGVGLVVGFVVVFVSSIYWLLKMNL